MKGKDLLLAHILLIFGGMICMPAILAIYCYITKSQFSLLWAAIAAAFVVIIFEIHDPTIKLYHWLKKKLASIWRAMRTF